MKKFRYVVILDRDTGVDQEETIICQDPEFALGHAKHLCEKFGIDLPDVEEVEEFELGYGNENATVYIFEKELIGG